MAIADDLASEFTRYGIDINRYIEDNSVLKTRGYLIRARKAVNRRILELDLGEGSASRQLSRLRAVRSELNASLTTIYEEIGDDLDGEIIALAELDAKNSLNLLNTTLGANLFSTGLTPELVQSIASGILINGAPSREWWERQKRSLQERFADVIRNSIFLGEDTRQVVRTLIGTRTQRMVRYRDRRGTIKREAEFVGGILQVTERQATALVRTSLQTILQQTRFNVYQANSDILNGYQSLTVLDSRTSKICISRSGTAWDLDGNPLGDTDIRFPGSPPWHYQCRTTLLPILKSFEELADIQAGVPSSQRRRFDGRLAEDLRYDTWLRKQSVDSQRSILGPGAYDLWSEGKLNLRQLVDASGTSRTLEELRNLY